MSSLSVWYGFSAFSHCNGITFPHFEQMKSDANGLAVEMIGPRGLDVIDATHLFVESLGTNNRS